MRKVSSPRLTRSKSWLVPATCALSLSTWVLVESTGVYAQNPATKPSSAPSLAPASRTGAIPGYLNVLILAVDDLTLPAPTPTPTAAPLPTAAPKPTAEPVARVAPSTAVAPAAPTEPVVAAIVPAPVQPAPASPAPAQAAPAPAAPAPAQSAAQPAQPALPAPAPAEPPAITPAGQTRSILPPVYRVNAKKQKKPDPHEHLFRVEPMENITFPRRTPSPAEAEIGRPPTSAAGSSAPAGARNAPPSGSEPLPLPIAPPGAVAPVGRPELPPIDLPPIKPPGSAQLAAAPLRRALAAAGVADVMTTAPDDALIMRPVNSRRLSTRVLAELQASTALTMAKLMSPQVAAPGPGAPPPAAGADAAPVGGVNETLPAVIKAATRVGLATGYRTVIVLAVSPRLSTDAPATTPATAPAAGIGASDATAGAGGATYALVVVDTARETGNIIAFDEEGRDEMARHQSAAGTAAALLERELQSWPPVASGHRASQMARHMEAADAAAKAGDVATAQDELNLVLGIDPTSSPALTLMGDMLLDTDPVGAADAYQRAADGAVTDVANGPLLEKLAVAYTMGEQTNWPFALRAAERALKVKHDTAQLRVAMATAQFGRADLFRRARPARLQQAEDAEREANKHLERALELEPTNRAVMARTSRLMAKYMLEQKRYSEAVQALDRLARELPDDALLQEQYATALMLDGRRLEDAFVAWARAWKLKNVTEAPLSAADYKNLARGFDERAYNLARVSAQLTDGVALGTLPRETALLQIERFQKDMEAAADGIEVMRPPGGRTSSDVYLARVHAADLIQQALAFYELYLETGQEINRTRGWDLHVHAAKLLNSARATRW